MLKKVMWILDLVIAWIALYWVGSCVGEHIGGKIPAVWGTGDDQ